MNGETPLWRPRPRGRRRPSADPLCRRSRRPRRAAASPTTGRCMPGRSKTAPASGTSSGISAASSATRATAASPTARRMPGARFFPDARLNFAENLLKRRRRRRRASSSAARTAPPGGSPGARSTIWCRGCSRRLPPPASASAIASPACCPTRRKPSPRCSPPPRSAPSGRRPRPISAPAPSSTASARSRPRCSSPSTATAMPARRSASATSWPQVIPALAGLKRTIVMPFLGEAERSGRRAARRGHASTRRWRRSPAKPVAYRARALRPPALHPVLLRHHRRAQMHRPLGRRHAAPASQGAPAAFRHRRRRPRLLLHHARLDDVELAGLGARLGRDAAPLRRLALPSRAGDAVRLCRRRARDLLRHLGQVHRRGEEGRLPARRPSRPVGAAGPSPRPARRWRRRASTSSTRRSSATSISPRSRAAPTSSRASCSACRPSRCGAARSRARASAWRSTSTTRTAGRCRPARASWCARGRSRRCRSASGTTPTAPNTAPPISSASPASGATAISPSGRRTAASSSTAAPTPPSIPAACASAPARSTARSSRSRKWSRRCASARTGRATCASSSSSGWREGAALDEELVEAHQGGDPHRRQPAPCAGPHRRRRRHPAHQVGQDRRARRARGRPRPPGEECRRAGQPGSAGELPRSRCAEAVRPLAARRFVIPAKAESRRRSLLSRGGCCLGPGLRRGDERCLGDLIPPAPASSGR